MSRVLILALVLLCLVPAASVLAQEVPIPEEETAFYNICYEGGVWEGQCDLETEEETEWAWTCGYYYAWVLRGGITVDEAPSWCKFMLPDTLLELLPPVFSLCLTLGDDSFPYSALFTGSPGVIGNVAIFPESNTCEGSPEPFTRKWVVLPGEPDYGDPDVIVDACGLDAGWNVLDAFFYPELPEFSYVCTEIIFT